jgi:hypothetical protein
MASNTAFITSIGVAGKRLIAESEGERVLLFRLPVATHLVSDKLKEKHEGLVSKPSED